MSLANSKATALYRDALAATANGWDDTGLGFTEKSQTPGLSTVSRQLNTILFAVIKLNSEIESLKEELSQIHSRVKTIEGRSGQTSSGTDIKAELDKLTNKLQGLNLGEKKKETGGNLKVFRNPFEILKSISK